MTNPNSYEYRQLAELFHRHGYGQLTDADLPELAKIDRLFPCLVRCGGCRFTCAAQDVSHLVGLVEETGREHVRDISMLMNPAPLKPGPYGSWENPPPPAFTRTAQPPRSTLLAVVQFMQAANIQPGSLRANDNGPTGHGDLCLSDADPGL